MAVTLCALTLTAGTGDARVAEIREAASGPSLIGRLSNAELSSMPQVCECEFFSDPARLQNVVFATRKERTTGLIMVRGQLIALEIAARSGDRDCRRGRRYTERWTAGSTRVVLKLQVTRAGAEACWYKGRMTAAAGRQTETVTVTGACGC